MAKIVFISDTHISLHNVEVPKCDILIHSGDIASRGSFEEIVRELDVLADKLEKADNIVLVAGNHDKFADSNESLMKELCEDRDIYYLRDSEIELCGLRVYGSPYSPTFPRKGIWGFNADRGKEIKAIWDKIPEGIDILVTHGPPYGVLDECPNYWTGKYEKVGCKDLLDKVLKIKPQVHSFGHIHESYGQKEFNGIKFVNASQMDGDYKLVNKPIILDINKRK